MLLYCFFVLDSMTTVVERYKKLKEEEYQLLNPASEVKVTLKLFLLAFLYQKR